MSYVLTVWAEWDKEGVDRHRGSNPVYTGRTLYYYRAEDYGKPCLLLLISVQTTNYWRN